MIRVPNISVTKEGCEQAIMLLPELVNKIPYLDAPDDALNYFFSKILSSEESAVKEFLKTKVNIMKKRLKKASTVSKNSFEEVLESIEETKGEETGEWISELRKLLGLKKKKIPANDESGSDKKEDTA